MTYEVKIRLNGFISLVTVTANAPAITGHERLTMTTETGEQSAPSSLPCYPSEPEHPYDAIVREWKSSGKTMAMGKHTAANATTCRKMINELEAAGLHDTASWGLWMLWWRWQDATTHAAIVEDLKRERDQYRQRMLDATETSWD
jgi:hypothetical protein